MADKWTAKDVAEHFEEAVLTLKKLPSIRVRGYTSSWPEILRTPEEIADGEPVPLRLRATPDAISRLDKTFDWIDWVERQEWKLLWQRGARTRWKTICWELGCDRSTAWRKWNIALAKIAARLNS